MLKYILPLLITSSAFADVCVVQYWYHGHYYLIFNESSVIHDPDCGCHYDPKDIIIDDD
jgi:hypothetical protein